MSARASGADSQLGRAAYLSYKQTHSIARFLPLTTQEHGIMNSLPADLKLEVYRSVLEYSPSESFFTLHSLAQTSKAFYEIYTSHAPTLLNQLVKSYIQPREVVKYARLLASMPKGLPTNLMAIDYYNEDNRSQDDSKYIYHLIEACSNNADILYYMIEKIEAINLHPIDCQRALVIHSQILRLNSIRLTTIGMADHPRIEALSRIQSLSTEQFVKGMYLHFVNFWSVSGENRRYTRCLDNKPDFDDDEWCTAVKTLSDWNTPFAQLREPSYRGNSWEIYKQAISADFSCLGVVVRYFKRMESVGRMECLEDVWQELVLERGGEDEVVRKWLEDGELERVLQRLEAIGAERVTMEEISQ